MENKAPTPEMESDREAIAEEARDLSDWMRQPQPETETRRQAREASMRNLATRILGGDATTG